jgi:hypothetical protein
MSSNEAYDCFVARQGVVSPRLLVPKAPETESREFRRETSIRGAGVGRADPRVEGGATRVRDPATGAARQAIAMATARGSFRAPRVTDCVGRTRSGTREKRVKNIVDRLFR